MIEIKVPVIPGKSDHVIGKISIRVNDKVKNGDSLLQIETGKGNRDIKSNTDGIISEILVEEGDKVKSNDVIILIEEESNENININQISESDEKDDEDNLNIIKDVDLLVIGAGPGGYEAAIYGAIKGLKVILVEENNLGGTCLNEGCIPTKSLIESARALNSLNEMEIFGIEGDFKGSLNIKKAVNRKDEVVNKLRDGISYLIDSHDIKLIKERAHFVDNERVMVGNSLIEAKNIIIATGSISNILDIEGRDLEGVFDSSIALNLKEIPKSITIIGGGAIGLEFAFIYNSFGTDVSIIEYEDNLIPMFDKDASDFILKALEDKNIKVMRGSKVESIKKSINHELIISFNKEDKSRYIVSEKVLMATGRKANIKGLDLDKTDIKYNKNNHNIEVNEYKQTSIPNIYAIGDVSNKLKLAHLATYEGYIAIDHMLNKDLKLNDLYVPSVVFTDPEIAIVGLCEEDLIKKGIDYKVSTFNFNANGKALTMNKDNGFIKILGDNEGKILGCVIVGEDSSNLIASLTIAMKNNISIKEISETIFAHPTTSEVIFKACQNFIDGEI